MFSVEALVAVFLAVMLVASIISHRARVPYTLVLVILGIDSLGHIGSFISGSGDYSASSLPNEAVF